MSDTPKALFVILGADLYGLNKQRWPVAGFTSIARANAYLDVLKGEIFRLRTLYKSLEDENRERIAKGMDQEKSYTKMSRDFDRLSKPLDPRMNVGSDRDYLIADIPLDPFPGVPT